MELLDQGVQIPMATKTCAVILALVFVGGCASGKYRYVHPDYPSGEQDAELTAISECWEGIDDATREQAQADGFSMMHVIYAPLGPVTVVTDPCDGECKKARTRIKILIHQCMEGKGWVYTGMETYSDAIAQYRQY